MFLLFQLIICICPIVPLIFLARKIYRFNQVLNRKSCIREKQIQFKSLKDFFPKKIEHELRTDQKIVKVDAEVVISAYKKLFTTILIYIAFWVIYISFMLVRIIRAFNSYYEMLEPEKYGCVIGSILMSILVTYWLLLTPIFDFFHLKKLSTVGIVSWKCLQVVLKKFEEFLMSIFKYCLELFISFYLLYAYILLFMNTLKSLQIYEITFWMALVILMCYQYVVLRLVSGLLKKIILQLNKKFKRFLCFKKFTKGEIMYHIFKNCTYLSMVFVYAVAVETDKLETPMVSALGVLFLIDTFWVQEKDIQKTIECDSEEIKDHIQT